MPEKPFIACRIPQGLHEKLVAYADELGENKKTQVIIDALAAYLGYSDSSSSEQSRSPSEAIVSIEQRISQLEASITKHLAMHDQIVSTLGERLGKLEQATSRPTQAQPNHTLQKTIFDTDDDNEAIIESDNETETIKVDNVLDSGDNKHQAEIQNEDTLKQTLETGESAEAKVSLPAKMSVNEIVSLPGLQNQNPKRVKQRLRNIKNQSKSQSGRVGRYLCKLISQEPEGTLIFDVSLAQEA